LTQPPIIVQNLLAKLKIRCDYEKDGCDHVSQLENLTTHLTKYCSFNPDRKCRDCGALKDENIEHNCIQNLFAMVKSSSESIRDVQTELACVKESIEVFGQTQQIYDFEYVNNTQELSSLRSEIDKLKRDKEDYKMNENMHLIKIESLSDEFSKLMSEVEVLKEEIKVLRFQIQVHYRSISNINLIFSGTQEILNFFELRLKYFEI
jgi:chromosome segregation ATPase